MSDREHAVTISTLSILKVLFIGLLVWFLWSIKEILLLFIISIIIASAMDPLVDWLQKRRIPRGLSVLLVYAVFIGLLVLIGVLLTPAMTQQFEQISQSNFYDEFRARIGVYRENIGQSGWGQALEQNIRNWTGNFSDTLFDTTRGVVTGFASFITVLVLSFYLTVEENGMKNLIRHLTPFKHQAYTAKLITKIQRKMGHWVLGQLILSGVIFGLTFLGLTILKVEFALVLALIAGILEMVPYIGPFLALIPAVFFAFLQSPALAVIVIVLYIVIQQIENHILVPVVMSKSVGLNPVLVILAVLIGGSLGGIVGAIIAIPIVSGVAVFIADMFDTGEEVAES